MGGEFADIFIERKTANLIACEADKIEQINSGIDIGAGIRVVSGETTAYAYTNSLRLESLYEVARTVSQAMQQTSRNLQLDLRTVKPDSRFLIKERPDQVPVERKVQIVETANRAARGISERIRQVMVSYGDVIQNVTIANSDGLFVEDERVRTRFVVQAIAAEQGIIQTGYESAGGVYGFELFDTVSGEKIAQEAARRAILMLEARPAPTGKMMVVMAGEAGGTMVHEACGHGLEADLVQKGLSVYAGKRGQQVASPLVTVIDDATLPHKYGSYSFDDEGVKGQKNILIHNGMLEGYMYDRLTAMKEKRNSTGNGRRESFRNNPIPRMTNTYIAAGETDPAEIIAATAKGLLVKKMGGGQVNTANGDFVFEVSEGYLIEQGKITTPVRGATLTGNGPAVLNKIDMVGKDPGFGIGTCGKDGQGVPVGDAQPTLRIKEIIVGGTE